MAISKQQLRLARALRAKARRGSIAQGYGRFPGVTQLRNAGGSSLALSLSDLNGASAGRMGIPYEMVSIPVVPIKGPGRFSYSYDGPLKALPEDVVARQPTEYVGEAAFFSKSSATEASLPNASGTVQLSDTDWGSGEADPMGIDGTQTESYPEYGNDDAVDDTFEAVGQAVEGGDDGDPYGMGQLPDVLAQGVQALQNADQQAIAAGAPATPPSAVSSLATSLFGTPAQKQALAIQQQAAAAAKGGLGTGVKVLLALAAVGAVVYFQPWKARPVKKALNMIGVS